MRALALGLLVLLATPAAAETVVATRTIRAQAILGPQDVAVVPGSLAGTLATVDEAIGMETRTILYAGRPIRAEDIGPPALIERNEIVPLVYRRGVLTITAEGRALARGGVGDWLRVMNLGSRTIVSGRVLADGSIEVGAPVPSGLTAENTR